MYPYSQNMPKVYLFLLYVAQVSNAVVLRAYISQHGLHGEIEFSHKNDSMIIRTNLKPTLQYPDQVWKLQIHEFPVDYRITSDQRCSEANLGQSIIDLTEEIGFLVIPGKGNAVFESENVLTGPKGVWGRSLVLTTVEHERVICASIVSIDDASEKQAVARFQSPIAGTLTFRWLKSETGQDSYIDAELYHIKANKSEEFTEHKWKIYVTDIFDADKGDHEGNCNVLQLVFDPNSSGDGTSEGDLDVHLGLVKVASDPRKTAVRQLYKNDVINLLRDDMEVTKRSLYIVIFDTKNQEDFLSCAKLRLMEPKSVRALINMDGIKGQVELKQRSPYDPTWSDFSLESSDKDYESNLRFVNSVLQYKIAELPPKPDGDPTNFCNTTGDIYNPTVLDVTQLPPPGLGTQDQYPIGDLLGKYKDRTEYLNHKYLLPGLANELSGQYWDVFLPLHGRHSVVHRSVVLERRDKHPVCGTLHSYAPGSDRQVVLTSAQVVFRYPLVGRVVLRQPAERPWEDTTVIVEALIHADGSSINSTHEHRWAVHARAPGADFYNWTARCLSAGPELEPFGVDPGLADGCERFSGLCRLGDFTSRHGTLSVAGRKADSLQLTRRLFTDTRVMLSGRHSVMKRSLVIFDDHGPVARGERMACSPVTGLNRRKAVIQDWFGNGDSVSVTGKMELTQQSEYDVTNAHIEVDGLEKDIRSYRIHVAPVERNLEFPCEPTTLYDTYNPFHVDKKMVPPPAKGSPDQYELGDFSGKYGLIEASPKDEFVNTFNESQVSLFGPHSILGRSLVLHKTSRDRSWACASVERGYSPSEARELRAIASFHHPAGFAWGYVRMTQLQHSDGSASDTVMEVKLRYPGERDRNLTHNHNWSIFVNPVGVDAAVQVTHTRCVAGGYRWNPYFTQLADPLNTELYNQECGADNPLRCDVGDLTARLGTITVGGERQVFQDSNFPLEGKVSAMGRSIVLFGPERSPERFACANIEPDKDIIKYVNVMKPPRFVLGQFLSDVRAVLGAPEWMLSVDARRTRVLHRGACLQLLLHFSGGSANQLELDFTRLLASGRLDSPSLYVPGYPNPKRKRSISYRLCGVNDPNERKKPKSFFSLGSSAAADHHPKLYLLFFGFTILLINRLVASNL